MRSYMRELSEPRFDSERRWFLKTGTVGLALVLASRWLAPARAADKPSTNPSLTYVNAADVVMLGRIIPVILKGALPTDTAQRASAVSEIIAGMDAMIAYQPAAARKEAADLFGLLTTSATRALVAGIWKSWERATDEDVEGFLTRWRESRFSLLQSAYIALHNLITASWYGNPRSWQHAGYGGPPRLT